MQPNEILKLLPHGEPFRFVDELESISEEGVTGHYTFRGDEYFYAGHFENNPVTPGVILVETMAQIGLACLGIYLFRDQVDDHPESAMALSSVDVEFMAPVYPGEKVTVISKKQYFRFHKLLCRVEMLNSSGVVVCAGTMSGFIIQNH